MKTPLMIASLVCVLGLASVASASVDPVVGTTAIIGKDGDGAVCAETRDKLRAAYDAAGIKDQDGFNEAIAGGTTLTRGQRVLVIDSEVGSGYMEGIDVRVRVLSGPDAHLACWAWQKELHLQPAY